MAGIETQKRIAVVDIPTDATAEETERLLNEPYASGYYLDKLIFTCPGVGARAFFRLRAKPESER
jgi:hypothetical protein